MRQVAIEVIFLMVVLKLPVVYLAFVVYWAIRAEPRPLDAAAVVVEPDPKPWPPWRRRSPLRPRRDRPHGSPTRSPLGGRARVARAEARQ